MLSNFDSTNPVKGKIFGAQDPAEFARLVAKFDKEPGKKRIYECSYCKIVTFSCDMTILFDLCPLCMVRLN